MNLETWLAVAKSITANEPVEAVCMLRQAVDMIEAARNAIAASGDGSIVRMTDRAMQAVAEGK